MAGSPSLGMNNQGPSGKRLRKDEAPLLLGPTPLEPSQTQGGSTRPGVLKRTCVPDDVVEREEQGVEPAGRGQPCRGKARSRLKKTGTSIGQGKYGGSGQQRDELWQGTGATLGAGPGNSTHFSPGGHAWPRLAGEQPGQAEAK